MWNCELTGWTFISLREVFSLVLFASALTFLFRFTRADVDVFSLNGPQDPS